MKVGVAVLALTLMCVGMALANGTPTTPTTPPVITPTPTTTPTTPPTTTPDTTTTTTTTTTDVTTTGAGVGAGPGMMSSAITSDANSVYVISGSEIMRFDKNNLSLQSRASLPAMTTGAGTGAGPGGMPMVSAITVDDRYAYVLRGTELLKLDKSNMSLVTRTMITGMGTTGAGTGAGPGTFTYPTTGVITSVQPSTQQALQQLNTLSGAQFDQAFLKNVTNHYAGSIAFAQLAESQAFHEELRDFGETFARDRGKENETFTKWSQGLFNVSLTPTINPEDQRILTQMQGLSGDQLDIALLSNMYYQIYQAQQMSLLAQDKAANPEIRRAAQNMIAQQNREMAWLTSKLQTWYGLQPAVRP